MCLSARLNVKVRSDAGGRGGRDTEIVRYYQNYPQYKITSFNLFIHTRLLTRPRGPSDTVEQPCTENEADMIL